MERKSLHFLRLAGMVFGFAVIVALIVMVIGAVLQWNKPVQFSNAFFAAGAIMIILGTFSVTGGLEQRANFGITYAESAGQASIAERAQRMMADINQRYGMMILLISVGILLIGISVGIGILF